MKRYIPHAAIRYWIALKWEGSELCDHTHQLLKRFWNSDATCCIAAAFSFFYASVSGYLHSFSALLTPLVFSPLILSTSDTPCLFSTPWVSLIMLPCVLSFSSISLLNLSRLFYVPASPPPFPPPHLSVSSLLLLPPPLLPCRHPPQFCTIK